MVDVRFYPYGVFERDGELIIMSPLYVSDKPISFLEEREKSADLLMEILNAELEHEESELLDIIYSD